MAELNAQEIINFIANADKKTPVKVYLNASIADLDIPNEIKVFGGADSAVLFGDWQVVKPFLATNQTKIKDYVIENQTRNSAVPLLDQKISMRGSNPAL